MLFSEPFSKTHRICSWELWSCHCCSLCDQLYSGSYSQTFLTWPCSLISYSMGLPLKRSKSDTHICICIYIYISSIHIFDSFSAYFKKDYEKQWPDYFMLEIAVNCNVSLLPFCGYFSSSVFCLLSVLFHTPVAVFRSLLLIVLSSANFWVAVRRVVIQIRHPLCQSQCCDCF